jgi:hypothetical protein
MGNPLSPMIFNIFADMLAILIARAKEDDQVGCLIPHLVEGGFLVMKYADDTILFMEHKLDKAFNMKLILCIFEQLSDLKINFCKKYFLFLVRQMTRSNNTNKCLAGSVVHCL